MLLKLVLEYLFHTLTPSLVVVVVSSSSCCSSSSSVVVAGVVPSPIVDLSEGAVGAVIVPPPLFVAHPPLFVADPPVVVAHPPLF
ncbi:MAG: hypothetical protein ACJ707_07555, partial [Nitrososphaera sp.]